MKNLIGTVTLCSPDSDNIEKKFEFDGDLLDKARDVAIAVAKENRAYYVAFVGYEGKIEQKFMVSPTGGILFV